MRITSISNNNVATQELAVAETQAASTTAASAANLTSRSATTIGAGISGWDPQLNQKLSEAQQALTFLDQLNGRLQALKSNLSAQLASRPNVSTDRGLNEGIKQVSALWQQRQSAASSLTGQLGYSSSQKTQQRFKIRGLDFSNLQNGEKEALYFSLPGTGQTLSTVTIDAGLSKEEIVRRFNNALAGAGIRASQDENGELSFTVAEESWSTIRDGLSIKGGGIRFPTGQFTQAKTTVTPDIIQSDSWQIDDAAAMRSTLQEVINALERVQHARQVIARALSEARTRIEPIAASQDLDWAVTFASSFSESLQQPDYKILSSVAPALDQVSRDRVISLLSLN
jgi:hypothetical protein